MLAATFKTQKTRQVSFFPIVTFDACELHDANDLLSRWEHKMGPVLRGNQGASCHVLAFNGEPCAVTTAHTLIMPRVGNCPWLIRENTIELSRLCAERSGLCRVVLRLWREFVFPSLGYQWAMSYQDADLHNGNTYRFDGWERVGRSRSGPDTRSGREGRDKWVWAWPRRSNAIGGNSVPRAQPAFTSASGASSPNPPNSPCPVSSPPSDKGRRARNVAP